MLTTFQLWLEKLMLLNLFIALTKIKSGIKMNKIKNSL